MLPPPINRTFLTDVSISGSHNLNSTQLTGMISLAKPQINQFFARGGDFAGRQNTFSAITRLRITFAGEVPGPGSVTMLGLVTLGLAGLAAMRSR